MDELNEVQPIDGYVSSVLEQIKEEHRLNIDPYNPTRGQRLEAALAVKHVNNGYTAMEIMVGRRVDAADSKDQALHMLLMINALHPSGNDANFYNGFAHQYWGEAPE